MVPLPRFTVLAANYPTKAAMPTKALLDAIGGEVRKSLSDGVNTCALRLSWCLNRSGAKVQKTPGLYILKGGGAQPELFSVRVGDRIKYLERRHGHGALIYDARTQPNRIALGGRKKVQGVIAFDWQGPVAEFGATGHVDLFHVVDQGAEKRPQFVPACAGQCFWWPTKGPMLAHLWETSP
jgi:Type VI secretion system (T6SS), amidase effector protein 4